MGALFKSDGTGAGNLPADVAINEGGNSGDGVEELDSCAFFHPEVPAVHFTDDFSMAADDQISAAFDGAGQFTKDGEVVALEGGTGDGTGFTDDHIATCLYAAVPRFCDVVIEETDVAAALGALAGLGFKRSVVVVPATEAADLTLRSNRVEPAHQKGPCGGDGWLAIEGKLGWLRGRSGIGVTVLARFGN